MNTPISWIKAYVPDLDVEINEFVDKMTLSGSHVECYEKKDKNLEKIVVGKIETMEQHPDADKLVVCQVNIGAEEPIQIVTADLQKFIAQTGDRKTTEDPDIRDLEIICCPGDLQQFFSGGIVLYRQKKCTVQNPTSSGGGQLTGARSIFGQVKGVENHV